MKSEINAIIVIAARDVTKLLRDRMRLVFSFVFPLIFIGILGQSLQSNLSSSVSFNLLLFTFLGVLAQTFFQSTASGIISLVSDRDNDFAQEMFVAPVSRYTIIAGKILGESAVSILVSIGIIILGLILGIPLDWPRLLLIMPFSIIICFLGGTFGVLIMSNISGQQAAQQVFPLVIFPQFFLAGVFSPITNLPPILFILSRIAPMTYAIDFFRGLYYLGKPEASQLVLHHPLVNLVVIAIYSLIMLTIGTRLFVSRERNR